MVLGTVIISIVRCTSLMSHFSCLNVPIWLIHRSPHGITFIAEQRASEGQFGAVEITSITPSPSNKISSLGERPHSNCTVIFGSPYSKANTGGSGRKGDVEYKM